MVLLADIRDVFDQLRADRLHTTQLLEALGGIEEHPWRGWWTDSYTGGLKAEAAYKLAKMLKPYGIQPDPHPFPIGGSRARGYSKAAFAAAWKQYLTLPAVPAVSSVQSQTSNQAERTDSTDGTGQRLGHGLFKRWTGSTQGDAARNGRLQSPWLPATAAHRRRCLRRRASLQPSAGARSEAMWLTIAPVAEELCVSPRTALRWIERGDLPAVRLPGGRIRVARCELDAALIRWATQPRRMLAALGHEGGDGADRECD